jgi:ankyrin repeat protein
VKQAESYINISVVNYTETKKMDDMFGMLMNGLSPERQLVAAVTSGMSDTVCSLVQSGGRTLVNAVLQQQNGRTALHIACQIGRHEYIDWFVSAGANPDGTDFFGMTPLDHALRSGHERCVEAMLSLSSSLEPFALWTAQTRAGGQTWRTFSSDVVSMLIIATPNFDQTDASNVMRAEHFKQPARHEQLIRMYLLTGNKLKPEETFELVKTGSADLRALINSLMFSPPSLQHACRLAVRRNLRTNVIYAARILPIPAVMQKFLVSFDT